MIGPTPQTILTVVTGGAREGSRAIAHGVALPPFSVGTQGAWAIFAPGVEPVHLFLGFDGTQVHVAKAAPSYQVLLAGIELGQGWHLIPVPCELRFGGACIAVTADEKRLITQPFGQLGAQGDEPLAPPGQVRTQFIARPSPVQSSPPAQPVTAPVLQVPGHDFVPVQPTPHVQGGQAWQTTQPIGSQAPPTPHGFGGTVQVRPQGPVVAHPQPPVAQEAPAYPRVEPAPAVVLGQGQQPFAQPVNPQAPTQLSAPSGGHGVPAALAAAPTMNSASPSSFQPSSGPRTLGDGGALREHAARVAQATPSVAFASAQAYVADVQRASGTTPPPAGNVQPGGVGVAPPPNFSAPSPALEGASALPKPEGVSGPPAQWVPDEGAPKPKASGLRASWREASLVKKLTVALLPFGLLGVLLMPDEQPAAPAESNVPSASGSSSASPVSESSAVPSAAAIQPSADSAPAATPSAGPAPELAASGAPLASGAPVAATSASGAPVIAVLPASSSGAVASAARGSAERDAINAAFEGRSAFAAKLYERLASASGDRVFALAARLAREDIVRKPAISH